MIRIILGECQSSETLSRQQKHIALTKPYTLAAQYGHGIGRQRAKTFASIGCMLARMIRGRATECSGHWGWDSGLSKPRQKYTATMAAWVLAAGQLVYYLLLIKNIEFFKKLLVVQFPRLDCFHILKIFLKKFKIFYLFLYQINIFLVFLNHFDIFILKIIFKK